MVLVTAVHHPALLATESEVATILKLRRSMRHCTTCHSRSYLAAKQPVQVLVPRTLRQQPRSGSREMGRLNGRSKIVKAALAKRQHVCPVVVSIGRQVPRVGIHHLIKEQA